MHSSGRSALAWGLLLCAGVLALAAALELTALRGEPWRSVASWSVAALIAAAGVTFWAGQREVLRRQRALAAGLAHHVRTPLAHIRMFTEMLLLGQDASEDERREWLEVIDRETHRLGDVAENLLLVAHDAEARPYPARRATDLSVLLEDVAASYASDAAGRGMRIVSDLPEGVTATVAPAAIRHAVVNLLDNAIRHGREGQTVTLALHTTAENVIVTVEDGGPGIAPRDRQRIWKPFARVDRNAAAEQGCGLGLAVVRQVVRAHGGHTAVEDAPGGGARFRISLPISAPAVGPRSRSPRNPVLGLPSATLPGHLSAGQTLRLPSRSEPNLQRLLSVRGRLRA